LQTCNCTLCHTSLRVGCHPSPIRRGGLREPKRWSENRSHCKPAKSLDGHSLPQRSHKRRCNRSGGAHGAGVDDRAHVVSGRHQRFSLWAAPQEQVGSRRGADQAWAHSGPRPGAKLNASLFHVKPLQLESHQALSITAPVPFGLPGPLYGCTQYLRTHSTEHSKTIAAHHGAGLMQS
jgi:hypothetical protein